MKDLSELETLILIEDVKKIFEKKLREELELIKVPAPLFVTTTSGLQDALNGVEESVKFRKDGEEFEVVHSLAKWKRKALGMYDFPMYKGLYTDMKAIRKDEKLDELHSMYVEQWDWEKVISKEDRNEKYLKETVKKIYKSLKETSKILEQKYKIKDYLPDDIYFISTQELEDLYPELSPEERERKITKQKKAIFIIGIGDKLQSGKEHDLRSPDYDDWKLNGDILIYDYHIKDKIEISSMGIRVDKISLVKQLQKSKALERLELPFHKEIIEEKLPYTIGGGIGTSRVLMLLLGKKHIKEVQASQWEEKTKRKFKSL